MRHLIFSALSLIGMVALPAVAQAEVCREFTRTIMVGGRAQEGVGLACRQEDGSWKMQSERLEEEDIAWNPPARERVIYVEREGDDRDDYYEYDTPRLPPFFQISLGNDGGYRSQCHRNFEGHGHDRGWREHGRGHGYGHHEGHHGRW